MIKPERRNAIALDEAYFYYRQLEAKAAPPVLFKVCNAIYTLDLALSCQLRADMPAPTPVKLTNEAWQRIRDALFDILVSSFPGYFVLYCENGLVLEPGGPWTEQGTIEFYPQQASRKNDSYCGSTNRMSAAVLTPLRWIFAEGRQQVRPADFTASSEELPDGQTEEEEEAGIHELIAKLYEICEEQAHEGKKKAHRKWWQLYWQAASCPNKREKHELQKQMVALQSIWGTPLTY